MCAFGYANFVCITPLLRIGWITHLRGLLMSLKSASLVFRFLALLNRPLPYKNLYLLT